MGEASTTCESGRYCKTPSSRSSACARWPSQKSRCEGVITIEENSSGLPPSRQPSKPALTSRRIRKRNLINHIRQRRREYVRQRCDGRVPASISLRTEDRHSGEAPAEVARSVEREPGTGITPDDDGVHETDSEGAQMRRAEEVRWVECCEDGYTNEDALWAGARERE